VVNSVYVEKSTYTLESSFDCDPQDAPWPMKDHDLHHTGRSQYSTSENSLIEKWRFNSGGSSDFDPMIDKDGTIYIEGYYNSKPFYLMAINPNGTLKWATYMDDSAISGPTPTISKDNILYVGTWAALYALNPLNGEKIWKHGCNGLFSSPAIGDDGTIYVGELWNGYGGKLLAINPNGTRKWSFKTNMSIMGSPAIGDDGTIYVGSGNYYFYAINPNGTLKWKYKTGDWIGGSPSIGDDGTIYVGSYDDYIYAFQPNGTIKWKLRLGRGIESTPTIGYDGTIYAGSDKLYAINPDGSIKWEFEPNGIIGFSSPIIDGDGTIFFCGDFGEYNGIVAVNPDGTERWRKLLTINDFDYDKTPAISSDGTVYVVTNKLYMIDPKYDAYRWTSYLSAFGNIYSNVPPEKPIVLNNNSNGTVDVSYIFEFKVIEPDVNPFRLFIDWGDGSITSDELQSASDEKMYRFHSYKSKGVYDIKVWAVDVLNVSSDVLNINFNIDNTKPSTPTISGPSTARSGEEITIKVRSTDLEQEEIYYRVWWHDGTNSGWDGPYKSGETIDFSHTYNKIDHNPIIQVESKDNFGGVSDFGLHIIVISKIKTFSSFMNNNIIHKLFLKFKDKISYFFDWDDGTNSSWTKYDLSDNLVNVIHNWTKKGTYNIKVKAKDEHGYESDWATLTVSMPKNKVNNKFLNTAIFERTSYATIDDDEPPYTHLYFDTVTGEVTLIAVDYPIGGQWSGVKATYYKIDSGDFEVYTAPFILPEGTHTVYFYSEDIMGNKESTRSKTLTLDTTPPTVCITSPKEGGRVYLFGKPIMVRPLSDTTLCIGKVPVQATADENGGSGVNKVLFSYNGETAWDDTAPYTSVFTGRVFGNLTISVSAIDNLGHESYPVEITIKCYCLG